MRDIDGVLYCNDGDWVESRTALVENFDGTLELVYWAPANENRVGEPVRTMGISENAVLFKQGPRNWLCQAAGAAAPSGGRALHEVSNRGGNVAL